MSAKGHGTLRGPAGYIVCMARAMEQVSLQPIIIQHLLSPLVILYSSIVSLNLLSIYNIKLETHMLECLLGSHSTAKLLIKFKNILIIEERKKLSCYKREMCLNGENELLMFFRGTEKTASSPGVSS